MPSSDAVVAFLEAMLQVGPDEGSVDAAQDILVSMHEQGWAGLTKEVKNGVRALKAAVKAAQEQAEGQGAEEEEGAGAEEHEHEHEHEQERERERDEEEAVGLEEEVSVEVGGDGPAPAAPRPPPAPPPPLPAAVLPPPPPAAPTGPSAAAQRRAAADEAPPKPPPPPPQRTGSYASIPSRTYSSSPTAMSTALVPTISAYSRESMCNPTPSIYPLFLNLFAIYSLE